MIYTDAYLTANKDAAAGPAAEYEILMPLPAEVRDTIVSEAHTRMNYTGGRWSDNLRASVAQWKRDETFPFMARAAAHREAEARVNAARFSRGQDRITLPMN